ncbi:sensor histidine kinase [Stenotrophomonas mori]|uniref:histidine kinase n=1 Tax=Stenotrophomonas mori TaxID=2871096 RepID=A0ABT0SGC9_9GAMM|nr:HAMP domain-containing sensor histidine kinase [Stenotrophomonas mori]MCL7714371.1 HAMP domain-containing histidine kinase [Stenotrophomonas mori]
MKRRPLRRKLLGWLASYLALLTVVLFSAANYVHEHAEHSVWRALLDSELDSVLASKREDPDYRWQDSDTLHFFGEREAREVPAALVALEPGLHDGIRLGGRRSAVMVRQTPDFGRVALVLDITDFAALERFITRWAMLVGAVMVVVTLAMVWIGVGQLVNPLATLIKDIAGLKPGRSDQRLQVAARASSELEVIADSLNDYLERNARFVERERAFISTASHELRTPMAVISGAVELALEQPDLPPRARQQLQRVRGTTAGVEQLIQLMLVLARDPARLALRAEPLALDELLPEIVDDHAYLAVGKELTVRLEETAACTILAPVGVVQSAVGNLLRNALENSARGVIRVTLSARAVVTIDDPGDGMSPEEVAAAYARIARGERGMRTGIGLELIGRLCEHLGWKLDIHSGTGRGTRVILDMGASLP